MNVIFGLFVVLLVKRVDLAAEDWPQFRGPDGMGVSTSVNVPVQFGPEKNVVWQTALPPGHSSPVLMGDRIFLTAFEGKKLFTLCLKRWSGRILWQREAPRDRFDSYQPTNSPASPTPVTDGRHVYVFFGDFGLIAYTVEGQEVWRLPLGPFNNVNGHGSSPILVDGKLVLICDQDSGSFLIAVDQQTGNVAWRTARPEVTRGYATAGVFRPKDGEVELVVPGAYEVAGYSLNSGKKLWWVRGMAWQLKSVPLISDGLIYVNGWEIGGDSGQPADTPPFDQILSQSDRDNDGKLAINESPESIYPDEDLDHDGFLDKREWDFRRARRTAQNNIVAFRHGGRGDVTGSNVVWRYRKSLPNVPSPLLYKNVLFLIKDGGIVTTLDPKTGQIFKQARLKGAVEYYWASPVAADGKVYLVSAAGKVSVLKAEGSWELLAMNDLSDDCFATPAIADGRIYLRTRTKLYCFGVKP
jgi:outer membrane protein assembly factor BamB